MKALVFFTIIFFITIAFYIFLSIKDSKISRSKTELYRKIRAIIADNPEKRQIFGISNNGQSLDRVTKIYSFSSYDLGLTK